MPLVRDGSNRVTEYRVDPVGSPPGPVIRDHVSEARMADFAAERAAAARPVATEPNLGRRVGRRKVSPEQRQARVDEILQAVRNSGSHAEAGKSLGLSGARVAQVISELRRAGSLPLDVDNLMRARSGQRPIDPAGKTPGEVRREQAAAPTIESQGREVPAPETDRATADPQPPARLPLEVATPLSPSQLDGEDRCTFVRWLSSTMITVCDRPSHDGDGHRGRLIRIGLNDASVLGHLAVAS